MKDTPLKIGEKVWVITTIIQAGKVVGYRRFPDGSLCAYAVDCGAMDFDCVPASAVHSSPASALEAISQNVDYWSQKQDEFCKTIEEFKKTIAPNRDSNWLDTIK